MNWNFEELKEDQEKMVDLTGLKMTMPLLHLKKQGCHDEAARASAR